MPEHPTSSPTTGRRTFLSRLGMTLTALVTAAAAVPFVGFVLSPLIREIPSQWRDVGPVNRFDIGQTVEVIFDEPSSTSWSGVSDQAGAWLRRQGANSFIAFSMNCTHLGCPVRWLSDAELFMCPCHGGVYYVDGKVAAGPPREPLRRHPVRIRAGRVEIQTIPLPIT